MILLQIFTLTDVTSCPVVHATSSSVSCHRTKCYVTGSSVIRHQVKCDTSFDPKMTSSDLVLHVSGYCVTRYQSQCYTSVSSIGVDSSLCSELNPVSEFESLS